MRWQAWPPPRAYISWNSAATAMTVNNKIKFYESRMKRQQQQQHVKQATENFFDVTSFFLRPRRRRRRLRLRSSVSFSGAILLSWLLGSISHL